MALRLLLIERIDEIALSMLSAVVAGDGVDLLRIDCLLWDRHFVGVQCAVYLGGTWRTGSRLAFYASLNTRRPRDDLEITEP
jgi:hypothetical protein